MRLLLDTYVLLWPMAGSAALAARFAAAIADPNATLVVSAASVRDGSIKSALGKLAVADDLWDRATEAGCIALPVTWGHARGIAALPPHHADPVDRLLIAQARALTG